MLATEIWGHVFGFLTSNEDKETLKHLNLGNKLFHALSRPRLFSDFTFHPYSTEAYGMSAEDLYLPLDPSPKHVSERLQFWASEEIAPLVRGCMIEPLAFAKAERERPADEDPYTLLNAFFALLPRFVNLESLDAFTIHFTNASLATLSLLPKLTSVGVDMCCLVQDERLQPLSSPLKLTTFTFANAEDQEDWWYRALSPDTLQTIGLDLSQLHFQNLFSDDMQPLPTFPNVHTFHLAVGRAMGPHHFTPLAKFPGVKQLHLTKCHTFPGFPPTLDDLGDTKFCPLLEVYRGPAALLPFLALSTVEELIIDRCPFDDFVGAMRRASTPNNLVVLDLTSSNLLTSLSVLANLLPTVENLSVTMYRGGFPDEDDLTMITTFWENLPSSRLPPKLVKLLIDVDVDERIPSPPDFAALKDALFAARPTLTTLWIRSPHYGYRS
ncbi:hypothetical protein C8R46DRAFT_1235515 [Mycena filopes]|nr:hypothetical protein C8R46DRAFT_1235515 [Mycena filopes]